MTNYDDFCGLGGIRNVGSDFPIIRRIRRSQRGIYTEA